jgi:hypothetical protein
VESYTTVTIPYNDRVVFVGLRNCAEFSSRIPEVAQTHDAISGIQFLVPEGSERGGFLARSEAGVAPGYNRAVAEFWAVHVSGSYFCFLPSSIRLCSGIRCDLLSPRPIQRRLGKNGSAVPNWTLLTTSLVPTILRFEAVAPTSCGSRI